MRQILQHVDGGAVDVREVPAPICGAREVLIATQASLVSAGTERMILDLARKSLLGKARERPDQVRRVLRKAKEEGLIETFRQVRTKLAEPMAIGYSGAGVVLEVGREVRRFRPGQAVAAAGAHAELMVVPQNLVARVPEGVSWPDAAYGVVGSIALHGIRLARVGLGDRVVVIGLGLVGQLAVQLLRSSGCVVLGTDPSTDRQRLAANAGAVVADADGIASPVHEWTDGRGVDAVVLAAATTSNQPLELAAAVARRKARIVAVGAVGLAVPRREFYDKELELVVSSSYGPGRYDPEYEQKGQDYPAAYVRWTSQRNIEAVLEKIAAGSLDVKRLTTHSFPIAEAPAAYEVLARKEAGALGIVLTYEGAPAGLRPSVPVELRASSPSGRDALGIGVIGAGNFASLVLLPRLEQAAGVRLRAISSAKGVTAADRGARHGFERAVGSPEEVLADADVNVVFLATRHDNHSSLALSALQRGKAVFVEKPLAIETSALREFEIGITDLGPETPLWMVGFNRRFSRAARAVAEFLASSPGPKTLHYRFNAGRVPAGHWTEDPEVGGGRFVGEACHALELTCFLLQAQITRVFAEAVARGGGLAEDETSMIARLDDGSVATILYSSNGDRGMPKERIEVLGGGRFAVIDDFDSVTLSVDGRARMRKLSARDKGHSGAVDAFLGAARAGGPPPIAYGTLLNVSWATLAAMESLRTGVPVEVRTYRSVAG